MQPKTTRVLVIIQLPLYISEYSTNTNGMDTDKQTNSLQTMKTYRHCQEVVGGQDLAHYNKRQHEKEQHVHTHQHFLLHTSYANLSQCKQVYVIAKCQAAKNFL